MTVLVANLPLPLQNNVIIIEQSYLANCYAHYSLLPDYSLHRNSLEARQFLFIIIIIFFFYGEKGF